MMMIESVVLGHYISTDGIQLDSVKIEVILALPTPYTKIEVCRFIGYEGYYHRFIKKF